MRQRLSLDKGRVSSISTRSPRRRSSACLPDPIRVRGGQRRPDRRRIEVSRGGCRVFCDVPAFGLAHYCAGLQRASPAAVARSRETGAVDASGPDRTRCRHRRIAIPPRGAEVPQRSAGGASDTQRRRHHRHHPPPSRRILDPHQPTPATRPARVRPHRRHPQPTVRRWGQRAVQQHIPRHPQHVSVEADEGRVVRHPRHRPITARAGA